MEATVSQSLPDTVGGKHSCPKVREPKRKRMRKGCRGGSEGEAASDERSLAPSAVEQAVRNHASIACVE